MSKERARRRSEREAQAAERAAARSEAERRLARRRDRRARWTRLLPRRRPAPTGLVAARRRRKIGLLAVAFLVVQVLTWAATPDWATRLAVVVVSLFALPVVHSLTTR